MAYDFEGFFASVALDADRLLADASRQWPEARVRLIQEPFCGIGIGLVLSQYEPLAHPATLKKAFQRFVGWTCRYPELTFVWINASCIPVGCTYRGAVVRNGRCLATEEGDGALALLVAHLGVALGSDEYFPPFTRGYFAG